MNKSPKSSAFHIDLSLCRASCMHPVIRMLFGDTAYIMLAVRQSADVTGFIQDLKTDHGITHVITGTAFNYAKSAEWSTLVLLDDHTAVGIYIPYAEFRDGVCHLHGK
ncbi:MAG: hypothetical protein WCQ60_00900 [bacterium]